MAVPRGWWSVGLAPPLLQAYGAVVTSGTAEEEGYSSRLKKGKTVRRAYRHIVLFALLTLFASLGMTASQMEPSHAQTVSRPNILFILLDDLRASDLKYMPNTRSLLENQGVEFTKPWVTRSLCCPSRATIFRGQYTHNHKVWVNVEPVGGFPKFQNQGLESSTIATWLNDPNNFADGVDYDTILIGKYLNRYGNDAPTTYVPPGWDYWYGWQGMYTGTGTSYQINEKQSKEQQQGQIVTYQRSQIHDTDLHANTAEEFIRTRDPARDPPFFMHLSPNAPHHPSYYASRHADMFSDTPLPRPSSFNERDVSDKPQWVRNIPRLSSTQISDLTEFYRKRLRALQSVDEMVWQLVDALDDEGELSNTYIVFTSDNGIYLGEHRLQAKAAAYNAAPRVPLLIRGPGVPQGVTRSQMVLNNDLAPTFARWASVTPPSFVDGRSLKPLLTTSPPTSWRTAFLVEHRRSEEEYDYVRRIPNYDAVRTARYNYVEYKTGEKELYDLNADPTELTNIYNGASQTLRSELKARLDALKSCARADSSATSCNTAEGG
jgi:N-acetylglucosamine-6-sulfatase